MRPALQRSAVGAQARMCNIGLGGVEVGGAGGERQQQDREGYDSVRGRKEGV